MAKKVSAGKTRTSRAARTTGLNTARRRTIARTATLREGASRKVPTVAEIRRLASGSKGIAPVLMAVAATASGVRVDTSQWPPVTTPRNLLDMRFKDVGVGLSSAAQFETWRQNLACLLPDIAGTRELRSLTPSTVISDAAQVISLAMAGQERSGPTVMVKGAIAEARSRVADRWGQVLATKSSDRLLQRLTSPAREAFGTGALSASGLILEFAEATALPIPAARAASRTQRLAALRDAFYRATSPICAVIETSAGAPSVQRCWLNSTVRVLGPIGAVASVADHGGLELLDVPRVLRREMNVAGTTVAAAVARTALGIGGTGVRVAVIDGEVNVNHPAFGNRATLQENLTAEPFGSPDLHGTAVAGIIAAQDAEFSGVAPQAQILCYKVFATGSDTAGDFDGMLAIEHALRDGADVVNCSWGIGAAGDGQGRMAKAFDNAWNQGLVIVKSAGNEGPGNDTLSSPADAEGVIVVGATEREGTAVQNYSSRGPTANGKHPHLVAPGGTEAANIVTCLATSTFGFGDTSFGTSFAAPIVSGAAALLLERFPDEKPDAIRQRLLALCRPLGGDPNAAGAGLLDLSRFSA